MLEHLCRNGAPERLPAPTPAQWICVVEEAARHRIAPLVYRRISDGPWAEAMPAEVRDRLRSIHVRNALRNAVLVRQTASVVEVLAQAAIPVMLLKGIHLAGFIYPEPALRSMADIDIMVPRDRLMDVERILLAQGFGPLPRPDLQEHIHWSNHLPVLKKPDGESFEVHYTIERPTSPFAIDVDGLWARAQTIGVNHLQAWALSHEDLLLHLCLHTSYHHRFDRYALKSLLDMATLLEQRGGGLDWERVAATANAWHAGSFVYCALRLVRNILNAEIPPAVFAALEHDPGDDAAAEVAQRFVLAPQVDLPDAYLAMKRGKLNRLAVFARSVFLPRDQLRRIYGLPPGSLRVYAYYLVRLGDLLLRRGSLMLRVALRTPAVQPTLERETDRLEIDRWVNRMGPEAAR
jgi:hypothetical protein